MQKQNISFVAFLIIQFMKTIITLLPQRQFSPGCFFTPHGFTRNKIKREILI